ncbi:MAG: 3-oxoacyl-ACP reductase FabG [Candidatus Riflebacteria bacterium]|nr:3-oxoacyl-ACP reductase FabG [Candidatus Riflebacteria bacterium]
MEIRLDGKKALITGGTRGIGRAISIALASAGAEIAINYHSNDNCAKEILKEITDMGVKAELIKGDASDFQFGQTLVKRASESLGGLDILINNAAISHNTPFLMLEPEEWLSAVNINVNALYSVSHPVLKYMVKQKNQGKILNITSICGVRPVAAVPVHYAMTKAAINAFTYTLSKEVGRYGITVNAIAPGLIETDFAKNLPDARSADFKKFCPMGRIGKPEEVADLAVFMLSDKNSYMTGETVIIGGGL